MDRRSFTRLLALTPLALVVKPAEPERFNLLCATCGVYLGHVDWPMNVEKVGVSYCVEHAVVHPDHEPGKGLITGYHFGVVPGQWATYQRACGIRPSA